MHSRIFQIGKNPIDKIDYIEESHYYDHWFTHSVADYVNGDTDRADDIQWLKDCYENRGLSLGADADGEYFIITDKAKYFAGRFEKFKKTINELAEIALDDFADGKCSAQIYTLKAAYDDEFGFYVDGDDTGMETFDSFIRYNENNTKFYIGGTIDYHW